MQYAGHPKYAPTKSLTRVIFPSNLGLTLNLFFYSFVLFSFAISLKYCSIGLLCSMCTTLLHCVCAVIFSKILSCICHHAFTLNAHSALQLQFKWYTYHTTQHFMRHSSHIIHLIQSIHHILYPLIVANTLIIIIYNLHWFSIGSQKPPRRTTLLQ